MTWGALILTLLVGGLFGYAVASGSPEGWIAYLAIGMLFCLLQLLGWLVDYVNRTGKHGGAG